MGSCATKTNVQEPVGKTVSSTPKKPVPEPEKRSENTGAVKPQVGSKDSGDEKDFAMRERSDSTTSTDSDSDSSDSQESPRVRCKDRIEIAQAKNRPMIEMRINGKKVSVPKGITVYDACEHTLRDSDPGRIPPTFCFHPYLPSARLYQGKCGICEVEDADTGELVRSCKTKVKSGMSILTWGKNVDEHIKTVLKSKLATHPLNCPSCDDNGRCIFQDLLAKYDISPADLDDDMKELYIKNCTKSMSKGGVKVENNAVVFDPSKCLNCYRCIRVCEHVQGMSCQTLLKSAERNDKGVHIFRDIEDYHENMYKTDCIMCGQCSFVCPVGAISVQSELKVIGEKLHKRQMALGEDGGKKDEGEILVAQIAPTVRVTLSEDFGRKPGKFGVKQIVSALRKLGFDYVFDTQFTADLTVMEESQEFIDRVKNGGPFPMFTSCCPAWINLAEKHFPEFIPNVSSCKSPQQMMGAVIKSYWAEKVAKVDKKRIVVVSFMPCAAKKDEIKRPQLKGDVDFAVSTRELAKYLKAKKIDVEKMPESEFDDVLGASSGASNLFAASGGVTEAVLRTVHHKLTGKDEVMEFQPARGFKKLKSSVVDVNDIEVKVSVIHTARKIRDVLVDLNKQREEDELEEDVPHLMEIMSCPGGCIGGGGNPKFRANHNTLDERRQAVYALDKGKSMRKSHENPQILKLYEDYFGKQGSEKAKKILHTNYTDRCEISDSEKMNKSLLI